MNGLTNRVEGFFDLRLFEIAGTPITVATVVTFVLIIVASFWISRMLQRALARVYRLRGLEEEGTLAVVARLLHYAVIFTGLAVGLETVGIDLKALFAAGAVFAVALGFAMQNIAQNFVGGVILLLERAIKPGDVLELEGQVVRVEQMGIRTTVVRTRDEESLIVPNGMLIQATVKNYTFRDSLYRLRVLVGVAYESDLDRVEAVLLEVAAALPWRREDQEPRVLVRDFGTSSVDVEVSVWIDDPWLAPRQQSALRKAVWDALAAAGVRIAFPQLDVHFDDGVAEPFLGPGRGHAERVS